MLAEAILKAGPESIRTPDAARELLADQGALSEPDVAQAVGAIVQASADTPDWPAENLVAACNAVVRLFFFFLFSLVFRKHSSMIPFIHLSNLS